MTLQKLMPLYFSKKQTLFPIALSLCLLLFVFMDVSAQRPDSVRHDYRIHINSYAFDPLQNVPIKDSLLVILNAQSDSIYQLIQFKNPLTRAQMTTLKKEYGLKLDQYIPNFTYLEKVGRAHLEKLSALSFYRWRGNYEPQYKISPEIGKGKFVTPERIAERGLIINLVLHKSAVLNAVEQKLKAQGYIVLKTFDHSKMNGQSRIRLRVNNMADVQRLATTFNEVSWIEEEGDITVDNGTESALLQSNAAQTPIYNNGIRGEGQIVGIIDGILDLNNCFFNDPANANAGPTHRKVVGYRQDNVATLNTGGTVNCGGPGVARANNGHGTHTSGTIAGFSAGNADNGVAFNARLTYSDLNDIRTTGGRSFLEYLSAARNDGAFIHSNSWSRGFSAGSRVNLNFYDVQCQDVDDFTWNNEEQLVVLSSGNNIDFDGDGIQEPSQPKPPFTSKNGLCVAAADNTNNNVSTGGLGPTFDNRRKPDIYAPGANTTSALGGSNCGTLNCGGSSMATPAIAGAAALVRQYYTEGYYPTGIRRPDQTFTPSGALLKATLLNSTQDITGTDAFGQAAPVNGYPTPLEGWGRLVLDDALFFSGDARNLWVWDVRHASGLNTGERDAYTVNVVLNAQPLKITLAWSEPPAAAANFGAPVVNNLDLRVIAPDGTTFYRGNNFNAAGQSAVSDATTDAVNNVEMVLVNTPQTGVWRIEVIGTAVNQGNPSQGYALVATADTQDPPVPTGTQNTLVVLTELPGTNPSGPPSMTAATNLMTNLNTYITEASYGVTTINPEYASVTLSSPLGTYLATNHNPLIEMTQDVVTQLVTGDANVFTQDILDPSDDITRIIILVNDRNFTGDWATTGGWPYDLPAGLTQRLSVSISSVFNDSDQRLAHAVCHQLGMMDLYAHPGVTFAQPHVNNWDIMSNLNQVQPMAWSKEKALWLSAHNPNSIRWIPRPAAGANINQDIALNFLSSTSTIDPQAIAIGLTPNVANLANENVFFFIEARSNASGTADIGLPATGVLAYYVNENIRQGEGPVRIIDRTVGTETLDDAVLDAVGQVHDLLGSYGLRITRIATTGSENTKVRIEYDPIETQNDINIQLGNPYWISPDIWVDSQPDGFDVENGRTPADRGNSPVAGEVNRIYFKIQNPGPGDAFDVTVSVRLSEPHHTVGGEDDFNRFVAQKFYISIPSGSEQIDYVEWTPIAGADPHNCIKVIIHEVVNDVNTFNNSAQENIDVQQSSQASPYETITYRFSVTNPYDYYQLFYFRIEGLPQGWIATFTEPKKLLNSHERYEGTLTVQPPIDAPPCTDHQIFITSWMPRGNTLVPLGGGTLQVNLRNRTTLTATTTALACRKGGDLKAVSTNQNPKCYTLTTTGCTNPVKPNENIIIRYEDPSGKPVYRVVRTDAMGCYSDTYVVADGGEWKVSATYPGTNCDGNSTTTKQPVPVSLPPKGNELGSNGVFLPGLKNAWFSTHVGSSHPLGSFNDNADANIYVMADLSVPVKDNLTMQLMVGLAQLTTENGVVGKHPRWLHASVNVQYLFPSPYEMKPFIRAGLGYYSDKSNVRTIGGNVGIGGIARIKDYLLISPGLDLHITAFSAATNKTMTIPTFLTAHLGLIFK